MDFPVPSMPPLPLTHTWSHEMLGVYQNTLCDASLSAQASGAWPEAFRIIYIPFGLGMPVTVRKLWCFNGTAVSSNVNMGIYDAGGTLIVSAGSTAQSGTSVVQPLDITDTLIGPGDFYLALVASNTTATFIRTVPGQAGFCQAMGMLQQLDTDAVLPTTATFAAITSAYIPQIGFSTRADV